jgi:hypothetical protein
MRSTRPLEKERVCRCLLRKNRNDNPVTGSTSEKERSTTCSQEVHLNRQEDKASTFRRVAGLLEAADLRPIDHGDLRGPWC